MFRSAVYLLFIKDNKILLSRRFNTNFYDGSYQIPTGHIDGNESAKSAAVREAEEETSLKVKESDLDFVYLMHRRRSAHDGLLEYMDIYFRVNRWQGEAKIVEEDCCDDMKWFDLNNLPSNIIPFHLKAINDINNNILYSSHGFEVV